jgi:hypothetical protein
MLAPVRSWICLVVLAFFGGAALRPAVAAAGEDDEPTVTVTPSRGYPAPAPSPPPPPPTTSAMTPPAANRAQAPAPYPPPPPPQSYPPPPYGGYPPPRYAPYSPYPPPYPGYPPQLVKVHRARRGLVAGGVITFSVSWSIAATISWVLASSNTGCSGSCRDARDYLWIPVAGPLIVGANDSSSDLSIFILWSAAQAAGIGLFAVGMAGRDVMEYRYAQRAPTLQLAPLFARDAHGLSLTARW